MRNLPRCALLLTMLLCALAAPALAQPAHTRVVNAAAAPGGNGQTWATAYTHPQEALDEAATNPAITEIWVAAGTYTPTRAVDPTDPYTRTFLLQNNLALYGGFAGHELTLEERDWVANETVLSGGGPNWNDRVNHVVRAEQTDRSARIDGFTIRDGLADDRSENNPLRAYGGGIHLAGSATVANCTIRDNTAGYWGGGIWTNGSPRLLNCTFINNRGDRGGAAFIDGSSEFNACRFVGNYATHGVAIDIQSGHPQFSQCSVSQNANVVGPVVITRETAASIFLECTFEDHFGPEDYPVVQRGTFERCTFRNNGRYLASHGTFHDCEFYDNTPFHGMFHQSKIVNSRIVDNACGAGHDSQFLNCFIARNSVADRQSGLFHNCEIHNCTVIENSDALDPWFFNVRFSTITNSIFWGNEWNTSVGSYFAESDVRSSLVQPGFPEAGTNNNFSANPLFADAHGRLAPTSPAIDAGNNTLVPIGLTEDLDGNPRFHDDPGMPNRGTPGGHGGSAIIDLGAYEFQGETCYANCDNSTATPILNIDDFTCFINRFAANDPYANCDASTTAPTLNVDDFTCFINQFATGCP